MAGHTNTIIPRIISRIPVGINESHRPSLAVFKPITIAPMPSKTAKSGKKISKTSSVAPDLNTNTRPSTSAKIPLRTDELGCMTTPCSYYTTNKNNLRGEAVVQTTNLDANAQRSQRVSRLAVALAKAGRALNLTLSPPFQSGDCASSKPCKKPVHAVLFHFLYAMGLHLFCIINFFGS